MVDLNVITEALTENGFVEDTDCGYNTAGTQEFTKVLRNGDQEVFLVDSTQGLVTKQRYNNKDVQQHGDTKRFIIKHVLDMNAVLSSI